MVRVVEGEGCDSPLAEFLILRGVYIGFLDEHDGPSFVSLWSGLINPSRIDGPTAVFETWQIVFRGSSEPETVFEYKSTVASRAV